MTGQQREYAAQHQADRNAEFLKAQTTAINLILEQHAKNIGRFGYPTYNSFHEAKGVIDEEYDELWDEIKKHSGTNNRTQRIREEAVDLAAALLAVIMETEQL